MWVVRRTAFTDMLGVAADTFGWVEPTALPNVFDDGTLPTFVTKHSAFLSACPFALDSAQRSAEGGTGQQFRNPP